MNIFIVHSGSDKKSINQEIIPTIEAGEPRAKLLALKNGGVLWKIEAERLIRQAQMILFIVGEHSAQSENITWELKRALRHNKLVVFHKLQEDYPLNECLYGLDPFTKRSKILAKEAMKIEDIISIIRRYENSEYTLFNSGTKAMDRTELFEQYKLFLETSENLVVRRQTVNSFYLSANTALITIMTTVVSIYGDLPEKIFVCALVAIVGLILSISWYHVLDSYGILNSSKMKIISLIERELPMSLYDTEWDVMSDKLNSKKYISFTDNEKKAPKAFTLLFILLLVASGLMGLVLIFQF